MLLSVIIVSYNTRELLIECLRTLSRSLDGMQSEIWVVDNGSSDSSVEAVRVAFPNIRLIENTENVGFGAANNQALALASGQYFLLLNSDAFPFENAIVNLCCHLDVHSGFGVIGPRLLNRDGSLQLSCFRFPTPAQAWRENLWIARLFRNHSRWGDYRCWNHDEDREVDWVVGACVLIRRDVYEQVGGFDERFFMYAEETDWQWRIRQAGWRIGFTPSAEVTHLGGASSDCDPGKINPFFFQSLDRYVCKHHGLGGFISLRLAMIVGCSLRTAGWAVAALFQRSDDAGFPRALKHARLLWRQIVTAPPQPLRP